MFEREQGAIRFLHNLSEHVCSHMKWEQQWHPPGAEAQGTVPSMEARPWSGLADGGAPGQMLPQPRTEEFPRRMSGSPAV